MRTWLFALFIVVPLCVGHVPAWSQDAGQIEFDRSGKGAVLCVHGLLATIYQAVLSCHPYRREAIEALSQSISDFEAFIARNGNVSLEQAQQLTMARRRNALKAPMPLDRASCEDLHSGAIDFFNSFGQSLTPEKIVEWTADTLSIERKPLMNPCL
ncbi:MAG: hypothetical protein LJE67_04290 [Salaquimonas sp.]|nr:hypothetical protein [Salaquimonas sp.]